MIILGIESSCDETAASICRNGIILSNVVLSQEIHRQYGGVIPEIASREHDSQISTIVDTALNKAGVEYNQLDAIAVTYGAGLLGALLVGLNFAKGLSITLKIPFLGINHLEGHLYASFISNANLDYPYLCFLVTGGHTQIWEVKSVGNYKLHSNTVDDAAGEAFDKGARILGLSYPGGPEIEKKAINGNNKKFIFPIPKVKNRPFDFSFSGLKTSLLYKYQGMNKIDSKRNISHLSSSYQDAILNSLLYQLKNVVDVTGILNVSIVGGVAVNKRFRYLAEKLQNEVDINILFPSMEYCTDNAAMIAKVGYEKFKNGLHSSLNLKANPSLALDGEDLD